MEICALTLSSRQNSPLEATNLPFRRKKLHLHLAVLVACFIGCRCGGLHEPRGRSPPPAFSPTITTTAAPARTCSRTALSPANVSPNRFGRRFRFPGVTAPVYAQPLYVPNLSVPGKGVPYDVVYVATEHDSVDALDADPRRWRRCGKSALSILLTSQPLPSPTSADAMVIVPEIGITSTPVIESPGQRNALRGCQDQER